MITQFKPLDGELDDLDDLDDTPSAPTIIATDPSDLAVSNACVPGLLAPDGRLIDCEHRRVLDLRAIGPDLDQLLILARDTTDAQEATIEWLAAAVFEHNNCATLLRRVAGNERARETPNALEAHVATEAWDQLVPLAGRFLESQLYVPLRRRRRTRVSPAQRHLRWLRLDPRPAPMMKALEEVITGRRLFVGARLPLFAEPWHTRGDVEAWSAADDLDFQGDALDAEVLVLEELASPVPRTVLAAPEVIPHDPRPYSGELAFIADIETCARRIAALHLAHGDMSSTTALIEKCAESSDFSHSGTNPSIDAHQALRVEVARLLGR